MSRLTQRVEDHAIPRPDIRNNGYKRCIDKLAYYEDLEEQGLLIVIDNETFQRDNLDRCTHRHCNKCDKYRRDLQRYKNLEDKGRLIELPCAVGDTVYQIIESISFGEVGDGSSISRRIDKKEFHLSLLDEFGKTVFLTKEAAEAKLAEMEGAE